MAKNKDQPDVYFIPPNFLSGGKFFGGMLRARNVFEAGVLVLATGLPILRLPFSLSTRIMIMCLITLPLGILGAIGIEGDSISEFLINWFRWLCNRRKLYRRGEALPEEQQEQPGKMDRLMRGNAVSPPAELDITIRDPDRKKRNVPKQKKLLQGGKKGRTELCTEDIIPIKDIRNGIVETKDGRYLKILEIEPINFLLRSAREQQNIVMNFAAWLKIAPVRIQIKVMTKKADIGKHLLTIAKDMEKETNPRCKALQEDYFNLIRTIGSREAITRHFFLVMEYESVTNRKTCYTEIVSALETAANTARQYLLHCDNAVVKHDDENAFLLEALYTIYNRRSSESIPLAERITGEQYKWLAHTGNADTLPIANVLAPESVDFSHGSYIVLDGVYHSYLMIPSDGYNSRVVAGWTSLLVNAGEGIDVDFFFRREPKERIQQKLGQQIRINRSRIKETSDTNSDYDDYDSAIRAGYFLKSGLANYEDFYYGNVLITITADTLDNLEWRIDQVKRMAVAQDISLKICRFRQEDAMTSVLPLCKPDNKIFERSKRNMLTSTAASFYPFLSFELSDENGILLGINKHNNSMVIVDIFNSRVYKNANMAVLGTSGAGKTFTLQLMALRMRRKGTKVMILCPLKGHEFLRACNNIGGEFISISPASNQCINILEIRRIDHSANTIIDGSVNESSILAKKIQQVHIFFSLLVPDMNHEERQLLDEALIQTYAAKGITHDNDSLIDPENPGKYKEMPILGDLYEVLMASDETRRIGNILNRLVNGSARTFNRQTNVDLTNQYTVLDISELTGDLLVVGMFLALDFMWDEAKRDRTEEKAIIIDEAWELIGAASSHLAAEFVLEIFKTIRGYGGAAIAATQDLNDFFGLDNGKFGRGIINNAKTKIILGLEEDEARRVQETLHLTDTEVDSIVRFERGNGLISTNSNHVTVEFKASKLEQRLITTDRYELNQILEENKGKVQ